MSETAPLSTFRGIAVVIPTRNRVDLAEMSLLSAVQCPVDHSSRVLVSDNSTDDAQATRLQAFCKDLVRESGDRDITYVRPGRDLPMSEHWEWAREQAGKLPDTSHVMYLTDRTVLKPAGLNRLAEAARSFPGHVISFNNDVVDDYQEPVRLHQEDWSGQLLRIPSMRLLVLASELILPRPLPRMLNVLVPRAAFTAVSEAYGGVFGSVAPDFCFCFRHLSLSEEIVYIDEALTVMHGLRRSNGTSTSRGVASPDTKDFLRHARHSGGLGSGTTFPGVTTTYNVIAMEYLSAAAEARGPAFPPMNQRAYLRALTMETDAFVPGPMKTANMSALEAGGVSFRPSANVGRSLSHAWHYLSVLGLRDFVALSGRRMSQPKLRSFTSTQAALDWAFGHAVARRRTSRHLQYLMRGIPVGRIGHPLDPLRPRLSGPSRHRVKLLGRWRLRTRSNRAE